MTGSTALRRWLQRNAKRWQQRRDFNRLLSRQPARHSLAVIEFTVMLARALAGLNAAGLTASIALMIAAYTSLAGASDKCFASHFVSDTLGFARGAAIMFFIGGLLALIALNIPLLVWLHRNGKRSESFQSPFPRGQEFQGKTDGFAFNIGMVQSVLLFVSFAFFTASPLGVGTIFTKSRLTAAEIQQMSQGFEQDCKPSQPDWT